jgi:hypothetical protein
VNTKESKSVEIISYFAIYFQICTFDGKSLHMSGIGQGLNTLCPTPENFGSAVDDGFTSEYFHPVSGGSVV